MPWLHHHRFGAEVLEILLEAKNSRKVDVLSKIVQICG